MLTNRPSPTVLASVSALLVLAAGCGGQPGEYEERTAVIDRLTMTADTATTAATGMNNQVRLQAELRTGCDTIEIEGRGRCTLGDTIDWIVRDTAVARLYVYTSSGYDGRDTAAASFLARRAGRTWVIVRSQKRGLVDSTLLVVEPGS